MARPRKTGLDYFPFDVDFECDPKIRWLKAKYGLTGIYIYIHLLCAIYREGYYLPITDDDICVIADDYNLEYETVKQCLNFMLKKELFDPDIHHHYGVLTSTAIQKRWQGAVVRRDIDGLIEKEYWLLDDNNDSAEVIVDNNTDSVGVIVDNNTDSTQLMYTDCKREEKERSKEKEEENKTKVNKSKVNESKVKESKVEESRVSDEKTLPPPDNNLKKVYGSEDNVWLTDYEYKLLQEKLKNQADDIIDHYSEKKALRGYNVKNDYESILNWGVDSYQKRREPKQEPKQKAASFETDDWEKVAEASLERYRAKWAKQG